MSEYIEREYLVDHIHACMENDRLLMKTATKEEILKMVADSPSADVQPVVRCGECLYFRQHRKQSDWCVFWNSTTDIYGFCSEGKRRGADK